MTNGLDWFLSHTYIIIINVQPGTSAYNNNIVITCSLWAGGQSDIQLYISFNPKLAGDERLAVERIQNCINDIKQWMRANKLKLNDDNTELLILS